MSLFTEVDRLKADLDALRPLAPEQEARVLQKFRLEWNYNSNAIEGNSLTLGETRSLLLHGLTAAGKPMRDHLDIRGHNEAVLALEDFVRSEYPLTEQFIREMHQVLLGEPYEVKAQTPAGQPTSKLIQPGRYKSSPNNVLTATGEMFYFATVEETPARMTDLVDWYRAEEATPTLHPVALAAEFHYRFVRIHPFDDGNGRMSRLLMNLILLRHGYPMTVIKNTDRNRYLATLAQADAEEFEPFLQFIIENAEDSLRLMIRAAKGESIDEPSDLDKKLALLKIELNNESNSDYIWNNIKKRDFYIGFFYSWLDDYLSEFSKFDFAFLSKEFTVSAYVNRKPFSDSITSDSFELPAEFIMSLFQNSEIYFDNFCMIIRWSVFKKNIIPFDLNLTLNFEFNQSIFLIKYLIHDSGKDTYKDVVHPSKNSISGKFLELPYKNQYSLIQLREINHQLANKVYDFIAAKVAEADTNPSQ